MGVVSEARGTEAAGLAALAQLIEQAGIGGRRVRRVVAALADGPQTIASLVAASAVDRRTVESVLAAADTDLDRLDGAQVRVAPTLVPAYRRLGGREPLAQPYGSLVEGHPDLVARLRELIDRAPAARRALDHVPATAQTVAQRALWLDATFELAGARVLCVGDHDLTSLAIAEVNPDASVMVVDVDDSLLSYVDAQQRPNIDCRWTDLRFGLPPTVRGFADLVVTDPPYTPQGVRLFLARGLAGLREHDEARLVMAYGYGEQPALGLKVQQAVTGLGLAYEAILPGFNRYHGAQAVGSSSDLYVLRPAARSAQRRAQRSTVDDDVAIYTHGSQSLEGSAAAPLGDLAAPLLAAAAGPERLPVAAVIGPGWPSTVEHAVVALSGVFGDGDPPAALHRRDACVAVDLRADPGAWLLRALLVCGVRRLALLVPNNHPDLVDEKAQRALTELVGAKYRLRLRRSTPGPRHAIVEAESTPLSDLPAGPAAVRGVLDRAHGKVANVWREALIRAASATGSAMTRNEARERIRTVATSPELFDERLLALPRHRLAELIRDVHASASPPSP